MRIKIIVAALASVLLMPASAHKYVGGDISLLADYEAHGAQYYDASGQPIARLLPFFGRQGLNAMRLRLFVDPSKATDAEKGEGVKQDLDYVKDLGRRIKDAGFSLLLDLHYSDTWADPAKQFTPDAWRGLSGDALNERLYDYTRNVLEEMVAAGAAPDLIQTGNEISYGMLWGPRYDEGSWQRYYAVGGTEATEKRFTSLLASAIRACREICPKASIVLHTERVAQPSYLTAFYDDMDAAGLDYDIIGLSYYPYHHGPLQSLDAALTTLAERFADKEVMIVETGYYHAWQPSDVYFDYSSVYPISGAGQKAFADDLLDMLSRHANVTGLFWWFMEANECGLDWATNRVTDNWYNAGLFDNQTGRAMPALSSLARFNVTAGMVGHAVGGGVGGGGPVYTLGGVRVASGNGAGQLPPGIYVTADGRKFSIGRGHGGVAE